MPGLKRRLGAAASAEELEAPPLATAFGKASKRRDNLR